MLHPLIHNFLHIHIFEQKTDFKAQPNLCKGNQVKFDLESASICHYRQQTHTVKVQT